MYVLVFLDPKTLLVCECMLSIVFAIVFVGMNRAYPQVRGARSIALSYMLTIPATILFAARGHVPDIFSVMVANICLVSALISMYEAVVRFTGSRNRRVWLWAVACAAWAVTGYYSEIEQKIAPRIVAISLAMIVIRGLMAIALFRGSAGSNQRWVKRFLGAFLAVVALADLDRIVLTVRYGAPARLLVPDAVQTMPFVIGVLYLATAGLCFLVLASNELVIRTRIDAHLDPLSGTFNRRGLEVNLQIELDRAQACGRVLSIALVDIDHFKALNDAEGHAAGDAAIRDIAEAIAGGLRGSDHIGRFGGDEFLLIFPQTGRAEALIVMERIATSVERMVEVAGSRAFTLSVGITEAAFGDSTATLVSRADQALYRAKREGRNCQRVEMPETAISDGFRVQEQVA